MRYVSSKKKPALIHESDSAAGCAAEIPRSGIGSAEAARRTISAADMRDLEYVEAGEGAYGCVKRMLDICLSALGLGVLFLPMLIVGLLIHIDDPGSAIFSQYRVGRHGKPFKLYKLRTMKMDAPRYLSKREMDDPDRYITRIGHILRKTSIDEVPQLFNVLRGDMSLVGPRPLIPEEREIHEMRMRFGVYNVRPGLTGLAQVNGRDTVTAADKVHWDVKYLQRYGMKTDVQILLATIPRILRCVGVIDGCAALDPMERDNDCLNGEHQWEDGTF